MIDDDNTRSETMKACKEDFGDDDEMMSACIEGRPIIDSNGNEVIPRRLLNVENVSREKIARKVETGLSIDNRNPFRCQKVDDVNVHDDIIYMNRTLNNAKNYFSKKPRIAVVR